MDDGKIYEYLKDRQTSNDFDLTSDSEEESDENVRKTQFETENPQDIDGDISKERTFFHFEKESKRKRFFDRLFGTMEEGSLRGSILILSSVALGISVFGIAKSMKVLGIIPGVSIIILLSIITHFTLKQLGRLCRMYKIYDLSEIVLKLFGVKIQITFDIFTMLYLLGCMISGIVIANKVFSSIVYDFGYNGNINYPQYKTFEDFVSDKTFWNKTWIKFTLNSIFAFVLYFPLCIPKDLNKLAWISLLGMIGMIYAIIVNFLFSSS